jgi:uncharacterized protein (UPF0212 family)
MVNLNLNEESCNLNLNMGMCNLNLNMATFEFESRNHAILISNLSI